MPELQDLAIQAAETIQTAHVNEKPSRQDVAPSTAADKKQPVRFDSSPSLDALDKAGEDEVPLSILRPTPRRPQMPPLPDFRFEQSYLASIKDAQGWTGVAYITMRDQLLMPLVQGMVWTLAVAGWKHWNSATKFSGQSVGARLRRWWWNVNNWDLPKRAKVSAKDKKMAQGIGEFYTERSGAWLD